MNWDLSTIDWVEMGWASLDSLYMVLAALPFTLLVGLPLGVLMFLTAQGGLLKKLWFYNILSQIVNILRSMPFLILMVAVIPLSAMVMGDVIVYEGSSYHLLLVQHLFLRAWLKLHYAKLIAGLLRQCSH